MLLGVILKNYNTIFNLLFSQTIHLDIHHQISYIIISNSHTIMLFDKSIYFTFWYFQYLYIINKTVINTKYMC